MEKIDIIRSITERTGGDIYLGVVGAVRIGLSIIGFVLTIIPALRLLACFFLAFGLVIGNLTYYLGNTLFNTYRSKLILLVIILINIITAAMMSLIFFIFQNKLQTIIMTFFIIIVILFIILFVLMPKISEEYKEIMSKEKGNLLFEKLSKRENEIVEYLLNGYTSGQLSKKLYISLPTIKTHISNIYRKLEINSKQELFELVDKTT